MPRAGPITLARTVPVTGEADPTHPRLRVAVDVTPLLGVRGGVFRTVDHLLAELPAAAPDIEVVPYALSRRARPDALPAGTRVLPFSAAIALRRWGWGDRPSAASVLGDVDVVHGTNFVVPPAGGAASTVTVHDTWCLRHPKECPPNIRAFKAALGRSLRRGAWAHVSTEVVADEVRALYGAERIAVVPFGVPPVGPPGPPPPDLQGRPYLLSISTLEPRKRIDHLVRAFGSVAASEPELQLAIVGADGAATDAVRRSVEALPTGIAERVRRYGAVDDAVRSSLLGHATALVYPSSDEGFGFPVLEAMAAGTPVVATAVGGIPEVAGTAALLVPVSDDIDPLVRALRSVVADERLRADLRRAGPARAARFSWSAHALGMAALWRRAATAS